MTLGWRPPDRNHFAAMQGFGEGEPSFDPRLLGADCDNCPLSADMRPVAPQHAKNKLRLVIVGEGPGRMEEAKGIPFIGPSGKLLDMTLEENGIDRDECHVTNVTLCRPDNDSDIPIAAGCCSRRLFNELAALDPAAPIAALGGFAVKTVLGAKSVQRSRGFQWIVPTLDVKGKAAAKAARRRARDRGKAETVASNTVKLRRNRIRGRVVFPTLHPAFILRAEIWRPVFDVDFARIARYLNGEFIAEDELPYETVTSTRALRAAVKKLNKHEVTVDIEADSPNALTARMTCVGIGDTKHRIVAIPWKRRMARVLQRLFDAGAKLVGHNVITFDCVVLKRYGVDLGVLEKASDCARVEDTLCAHHAIASHLPKSLAHCASVFTDATPWKQKAKGEGKSEKGAASHFLSMRPEELAKYNAGDIGLTALVWKRMQPDLADEQRVYAINKRISGLCARMRVKGFAFDVGRANELARILRARKNTLLWEMRDLINDANFSPRKAFDIRKVLFGMFKVPLIYPTKSGLPATSRMVLEQLRNGRDRAGRLSDLILRWRDADKTLGTYLNVDVIDGRVHGDWRIGPVTGRLACRIMTLPRYTKDKKTGVVDVTDRVRECYVAPPGYVLVYFDLSQAEMRVAAHLSGDPVFINACKGDVHAGNASVLWPDVAAKGWLTGDEAKKGRGAPFRDIAKNVGFAIAYLSEWEGVYTYLAARGFEVSPIEVRDILDRLHVAYAVYYKYVENNVKFVKQYGFLRSTLSSRIRHFGHTPKPTEVANFPIQTGIADVMNDRLIRVEARLPEDSGVIAQIHDAAIFQVPKDSRVDEVRGIVSEIYAEPVCFPEREPFVIPIDLKTAERWSDL